MNIEISIAVAGSLGAAFTWLYEYSQKSKWEKNRFLLEQIEKFQESEKIQVMQRMLDWNRCSIMIDDNKIEFDDSLLFCALQTHDKVHSFTKDELKLRSIFDYYFDYLTKLVILANTGLISKKNLCKFLAYWFKIVAGKSKSKNAKINSQIRSYLSFYGYSELLDFLDSNY